MTAADTNALTHVRADGSAHMVDVSNKQVTTRIALAEGYVHTRPDVIDMLLNGDLPKGEALGVARVAGILGAKQTPFLIPLCHPLPISGVSIEFNAVTFNGSSSVPDAVRVTARVKTTGVTGVEMEALTATSVACLNLFDMIKAVDKFAIIEGIKVLSKSGGKSGDWKRDSHV